MIGMKAASFDAIHTESIWPLPRSWNKMSLTVPYVQRYYHVTGDLFDPYPPNVVSADHNITALIINILDVLFSQLRRSGIAKR